MLIGNDLEIFHRLLGPSEVPARYVREYEIRKHMHDMEGDASGMGLVAIIDLLRFCGYEPPEKPQAPLDIDWTHVERGTRVELLVESKWHPGEFLGRGDHGYLHVQLDHDEWVKECDKRTVRIAANQTKPVIEKLPEPEEVLPYAPIPKEEIPGVYAKQHKQEHPEEYIDAAPPDPGVAVGVEVWADCVTAGIGVDVLTGTVTRLDGDKAIVDVQGTIIEIPVKNCLPAIPV